MAIEGVLLTGGASRRMGTDKAAMLVQGEPLGLRIARSLAERCAKVTVLGREPIEGFDFVADTEDYAGPLSALAGFEPAAELVFVASCDLVAFDSGLIAELLERLGEHEAAIPVLAGRAQPLCALYHSSTVRRLKELESAGERRVMTWVSSLDAVLVPAEELLHGYACRNVNTLQELHDAGEARCAGGLE